MEFYEGQHVFADFKVGKRLKNVPCVVAIKGTTAISLQQDCNDGGGFGNRYGKRYSWFVELRNKDCATYIGKQVDIFYSNKKIKQL